MSWMHLIGLMNVLALPGFWSKARSDFWQNSGSTKINVPNGGHGPVPLVLSLYFTLPPPTLTSPFASEEKGKSFYCKEGGRGRWERGPHVNIPLGANKKKYYKEIVL